ncbi:glycoside hydrolase family 47 protein [Backusella circina FSU 941]|nr:glycoside hydrolase family 47 protein [Backusella circina FSU 941]
MLIMGLDSEYNRALQFVQGVDFGHSADPSKGFETNIRYLGGLLAANDLRPNRVLVQKAIEVAEKTLIPLFVYTTKGPKVAVPHTYLNVNTETPQADSTINLAEFGTYSMEFTRLSQVTGNPKYQELADNMINIAIQQPSSLPGLYPTSWTLDPFKPDSSSTLTVGGGGDSYYEYLVKNYLLQNKKYPDQMKSWVQSVDSMERYLLSPTKANPNVQFVAMARGDQLSYNSQELICFWPGNILLGITQIEDETIKAQFRRFADTFMDSCIETWNSTQTGIAPESWSWTPLNTKQEDKFRAAVQASSSTTTTTSSKSATPKKSAKKEKRRIQKDEPTFTITNSIYDLRPETIESLFYYYRLTGDVKYQKLAWQFFKAIEKYAMTGSGFGRLNNVDSTATKIEDFQESFFFAETLKYLYLIFADKECISLNDYVLNTEAHPFKLPNPIQYQ